MADITPIAKVRAFLEGLDDAALLAALQNISGIGDALGKSTGTTAGTLAAGDDSRLSNTRTPTDGSVTTAKIANANVTTEKLEDSAVTDAKLAAVRVKTDTTGITGADSILNMVSLTQAEYDAIGAPVSTTLYVIVG